MESPSIINAKKLIMLDAKDKCIKIPPKKSNLRPKNIEKASPK